MKFSYKNIFAAILLTFIGSAAHATIWTVTVQNYEFVNNPTTVNVGDTILWIWSNGSHTTTSTSVPSGAATWDSPINSGSTSYEYVVTTVGTYNYKCTPHSSMMFETFEAVDAGCPFTPEVSPTSLILCPNSSDTLWASPAGGTYQWFKGGASINGATNQFLVVNATDDAGFQFDVEITLNGCTDESEEAEVIAAEFPPPAFLALGDTGWTDIDGTINLCTGDELSLTLSAPYVTNVQWYLNGTAISGATESTYIITETGIYSASGAPADCPEYIQMDTQAVLVNFPIEPVVSQSGNLLTVDPDLLTYQWYLNGDPIPGATNSTYEPATSGIYSVAGSDGNQCVVESNGYQYDSNAPCPFNSEILPGDVILCPNGSDTLFALPNSGLSYQWFQEGIEISGATNSYYLVNTADNAGYNYSVSILIEGCTDTSEEVLVDAWVFLPPTVMQEGGWVDLNGMTNVCAGDTVTLTLMSPYTENIQWYNNGDEIPGAQSSVFYVTNTGSYTVSGTPEQCPDYYQTLGVSINVTVVVPTAPSITQSNDTLYANPNTPPFAWYLNGDLIINETNYWIVPTEPGLYNVSIEDGNQCSAISAPYPFGLVDTCSWEAIVLPTSVTLCPGASQTLTVTLTSSTAQAYQWYKDGVPITNGTSSTIIVNSFNDGGSEFSAVVVADGCLDTSVLVPVTALTFDPISVTDNGVGWVDGDGNINICTGETLVLTLGAPYDTNIQWYNNNVPISGADNQTFNVTQSGNYTVHAAPSVCPDYIQLSNPGINVIAHAPIVPNITLTSGVLNSNVTGTNYQWYLDGNAIAGATNSTYTPTEDGTYTVSFTDENQCESTSDGLVFVGINAVGYQVVNIYPNPVNNVLYIDYQVVNNVTYRVTDAIGRVVMKGNFVKQLDVSALAKGAYMLTLTDKSKVFRAVFVKE